MRTISGYRSGLPWKSLACPFPISLFLSIYMTKIVQTNSKKAQSSSGHCEHIDLMDCSDFETDEMTCMLTATGMTCCVCTGTLRATKWSLF
ncbi:unnamed protein product [Haemonchus placei]|uniref:HMA domain-containing protein n=1 Tax=Haemonchus placei TaxID=6290 RepID=A0A0N4X0Q9_HAEPC|nr:unnamed protein product [Haemonchus placei]